MDYISLEILMGLKLKENTFKKKMHFARTKMFEKNNGCYTYIYIYIFLPNPNVTGPQGQV